ncbi:Dabb family protein [Luteolibacter pohnpeiensis]|uniref:Dabb family protein n=1 Tax=Luteolibacter pohnpeiensis TaxID=454153 RepID=A0A934S4V7_9BACT|nr:Dabb family protein [Luteolibacter pohnpeiensis]MBK1881189.1 Dabb family protein [Luteolibacter pohnpeiensis]
MKLTQLLLAITTAAAFSSCATPPHAAPGSVDHVVLMWQKRPGNTDDQKTLLEAAEPLREIPGVISIDPGTALESPRDVVDDSFDVCYVVRFDSEKSLRDYDQNPIHQKQLNGVLKPFVNKFLIYDVKH